MNWITRSFLLFCCVTAMGIGLHVLAPSAFAAEEAGGWRNMFDVVMRWLNFAILAFIIVKYAKTPLKNFLDEKKEEIARQINKIEQEKETAERQISETRTALEESKVRFTNLKQRIVEEGEKKKQEIIEDARQESKILLESARKKIDNQFIEAQKELKSELAEMAVNLAVKRLPAKITEADNQKWVNAFLASIGSK